MKIAFSPIRHDGRLVLHRQGDILTINGEAFDFSALPEGATLPRSAVRCDWIVSDVERSDGRLALTLLLPHGGDAEEGARFPAALVLDCDGDVALPCPDAERAA